MKHVLAVVLFAVVTLMSACTNSPQSRTQTSASSPQVLNGTWIASNETITIKATNWNSGTQDTIGYATTSTTAQFSWTRDGGSTVTTYPWVFDAGTMAAQYWAPTDAGFGAFAVHPQGRIEFQALGPGFGNPVATYTMTGPALNNFWNAANAGENFIPAWEETSDGRTTVLLDPNGVTCSHSGWTLDSGYSSTVPSPVNGITTVVWGVGHYTVEQNCASSGGPYTIEGLVCAPQGSAGSPVVIYNHGGISNSENLPTTGNINGLIASGTDGWWSTITNNVDELAICLSWASYGWVVGMSSYRGESVLLRSNNQQKYPVPQNGWPSQGTAGYVLGEVTDVLALTDILVNSPSTVNIGFGGAYTPSVNDLNVLMYGYSHGAGITTRAVQQGAPVWAFATFEAMTDLQMAYKNCVSRYGTPLKCANAQVLATYPPSQDPGAYDWRSSAYFANRDVVQSEGANPLQTYVSMPILMIQGDFNYVDGKYDGTDGIVDVGQACEFADDIGTGMSKYFVVPSVAAGATLDEYGTTYCSSSPGYATVAQTCNVSGTFPTGNGTVPNPLPTVQCPSISTTLSPGAWQSQGHNLVVYHGAAHTNIGPFAQKTFVDWVNGLSFANAVTLPYSFPTAY
jgi:hypothetical protein